MAATSNQPGAQDVYLTEAELSARFKIPGRTLQRWRVTGDGPPFVRIGPRQVRYNEAAAHAWTASRTYAHRAAELSKHHEVSA